MPTYWGLVYFCSWIGMTRRSRRRHHDKTIRARHAHGLISCFFNTALVALWSISCKCHFEERRLKNSSWRGAHRWAIDQWTRPNKRFEQAGRRKAVVVGRFDQSAARALVLRRSSVSETPRLGARRTEMCCRSKGWSERSTRGVPWKHGRNAPSRTRRT